MGDNLLERKMKNAEIKDKIKSAMASFWWVPPSFTIVERPELAYSIDPSDGFNHVSRIDAPDSQYPELIEEVLQAHQNYTSSCISFTDQSPILFDLLQKAGYQKGHIHDIRYCIVENHQFRKHPSIKTTIVQKKEDLLKLQQVSSIAFNKPLIRRTEEDLAHILKEYNIPKPRAIRVLATDNQTGEPLGSGSMSIFEDLGIATFFGGCTIPSARCRGVYSAVIDARIRYAQQRGIGLIGIYARSSTSSPIVEKQGFLSCGQMLDWRKEQSLS